MVERRAVGRTVEAVDESLGGGGSWHVLVTPGVNVGGSCKIEVEEVRVGLEG